MQRRKGRRVANGGRGSIFAASRPDASQATWTRPHAMYKTAAGRLGDEQMVRKQTPRREQLRAYSDGRIDGGRQRQLGRRVLRLAVELVQPDRERADPAVIERADERAMVGRVGTDSLQWSARVSSHGTHKESEVEVVVRRVGAVPADSLRGGIVLLDRRLVQLVRYVHAGRKVEHGPGLRARPTVRADGS